MKFYLGVPEPSWLKGAAVPMFLSRRRLERYVTWPRASAVGWALDSGGFTELSRFGEWRTTVDEYVATVRRAIDECGSLRWAAPMDWMCEPDIIRGNAGRGWPGTGLSVRVHQQRTIDNYLELRHRAPDLPFIPVLQGYELSDYLRCAERYRKAGVELDREPIVGLGTVCRRQDTGAARGISCGAS